MGKMINNQVAYTLPQIAGYVNIPLETLERHARVEYLETVEHDGETYVTVDALKRYLTGCGASCR